MKKIIFSFLFAAHALLAFSQPKLVVGIVVDQMRYDYLERYQKKYGPDGFRRLLKEGYSCENVNYNYVPTFTGPGHASIYTGATPAVHGIIGNQWYDRSSRTYVNCTADKMVRTVGSISPAGQMSPKLLFTSTMTDELQKATDGKAKIVAIALKDRGAVLPSGKYPTGAFWFDGSTGNWISSTFYMKELPKWVDEFNKKELAKKLMSEPWKTLLPIEKYTESEPDDSDCEEPFNGQSKTVFPYDIPSMMASNGGLDLIRSTPSGNTLTVEFAKEAIMSEGMGKDSIPDFLSISFSSPDYIGHQFGPQSVEAEDCYLRLDQNIGQLLSFLDAQVGKKNYLVFLTADHGAANAVNCSLKRNLPAGNLKEKAVSDSLKKFFRRTYKDSFLLSVSNFDIYLKRDVIEKKKLNIEEVSKQTALYLKSLNGVADAITLTEIQRKSFAEDSVRLRMKGGFNAQRSGDIVFVLKPYWLMGYPRGTTHGSPYFYDTHVPLIFFGWKIKKGSSKEAANITDIAPTVCSMLDIPNPSGCTGTPINQLTK